MAQSGSYSARSQDDEEKRQFFFDSIATQETLQQHLMDAGKVYNAGQSMKDAAWHRGVGGGVFLIATIVRINLDIAHGLRDGDTRVHLSSGFSF